MCALVCTWPITFALAAFFFSSLVSLSRYGSTVEDLRSAIFVPRFARLIFLFVCFPPCDHVTLVDID